MRDSDLDHLHPEARQRVNQLLQSLASESIPFRVFEGFRSPDRQAYLYAQGRTRPGRKVTNAQAWSSYHQYGVAADFVLYENGQWSWNDSGHRAAWWTRLHELAVDVGLKPLSWERPHLQMVDLSLADLQAGNYPANGDESWAENLADAIYGWHGDPPAPPVPTDLPERPAMDDTPDTDVPDAGAPAPAATLGRFRVTARSGLRLRSGPGRDFDIVGTLQANQVVSGLSRHGDWMGVDLQDDGLADGFCHGGYLADAG